jgi:8-oxo-dGTP pyrophosphatase MutT (NUDIX family)
LTEPPPRVPVPESLARHAHRFLEAGGPPAQPRRAATVVLVRPVPGFVTGRSGYEVYAQRRPATMAFAPNMYVFPGGTLDERDTVTDVAWVGPEARWWADRLAMTEADGQAVVCAAVREVFEECGVLLAGPDESTVVGDVSGAEWEDARAALIARDVGFADLLASRGLAVRSDLLAPWARWLTPEFEPRRYDTYFFVARLPTDQRTHDVGAESTHSVWIRPADGLHLPMLPPTALTLRQLAAYDTIDAVMAASADRVLTSAQMPRLEVDADGAWLILT